MLHRVALGINDGFGSHAIHALLIEFPDTMNTFHFFGMFYEVLSAFRAGKAVTGHPWASSALPSLRSFRSADFVLEPDESQLILGNAVTNTTQ